MSSPALPGAPQGFGVTLPWPGCPFSEPGSKGTLRKAPRGLWGGSHGCSPPELALSLRNLSAIQDREICCYSISCKEKDNIGECRHLGVPRGGAGVLQRTQAVPHVQDEGRERP